MITGYIGGLEDAAVEFFENQKHEYKAIYKSRCMDFFALPDSIIQMMYRCMDSDVMAVKAMRRYFGLTNRKDQLIKYIKCNFKGLDGVADISAEGEVHKEIHNCQFRDTCKAAFKVCAPIIGNEGQLTKAETKVYFLVCQGMLDKEIASHCSTSISTVETQLRNIRAKLGINNRVEIILHAVQNNISFAPTFN